MKEFTFFFEKLLSYLENLDDYNYPSNSFGYLKSDNFRFFLL